MDKQNSIPLKDFVEYPVEEMIKRAQGFYDMMKRRRSVRAFSKRSIHPEIIDMCVKTAVTAPSGANKQPWHFTVISSLELKKKIRAAAEEHERSFYESENQKEWHEALETLNTDYHKPFLDEAPYLIVVFKERYSIDEKNKREKNYYINESVNIAIGFLLSALQNAGLSMLTYTPTEPKFLMDICERPENESPVMIIVAGFPAEDTTVPNLSKKDFSQIVDYK